MAASPAPLGGRWKLTSQGSLSSLQYEPDWAPAEEDLGPEEVLVELHAASLNYRDLVIAKNSAPIPLNITPSVIPGSDGAGVIRAVGSGVASANTTLTVGAKVLLHLISRIAEGQLPGYPDISSGLGQQSNGTLCRLGVFHHTTVIPMPTHLSFEQAATMCCSGLTAWNAVMGLKGREVKKDDWVLTMGTGGVSIAALQIAVAAGANVIATTSSDGKAKRLLALGAKHVINYKSDPEWGVAAKALTPDQRGVDHVVDVVGIHSLPESLNAVRPDGLITIAGMVGGGQLAEGKLPPDLMNTMWRICVVRGVLLGSRQMMYEMVQWFEAKGVQPELDTMTFALEDAKLAYERLERQEHYSKVIIKIQ